MKRSRPLNLILSIGLLMIVTASCRKEQYPATTSLQTLQQTIGQDTTLSLFQLALARTGLDTIFRTGGPYTIFAPENSAFLAAGLNANAINAYDPQQLSNIISYHLIPGRLGSATIIGFASDSAVSLNRQFEPIITLNYYGLFIDGISVIQGNIGLADGILHKTARVAFPPTGTLLQVLDSLPNTTLAAYIYHHSAALTAYATDPGSFITGSLGFVDLPYTSGTLLIPTDAAFAAYGFNTPADLAALDTLTRTNLVAHGMLGGSFFTSDFEGGRIVGGAGAGYVAAPGKEAITQLAFSIGIAGSTNYQQVNLVFDNTSYEFGNDGLSINGNGILTPPVIVQPNIVANGGVLHVINQIFAPSGQFLPGHRH
jgi:uncharacterized surface protein with fasciclin (FAS1) repeats